MKMTTTFLFTHTVQFIFNSQLNLMIHGIANLQKYYCRGKLLG